MKFHKSLLYSPSVRAPAKCGTRASQQTSTFLHTAYLARCIREDYAKKTVIMNFTSLERMENQLHSISELLCNEIIMWFRIFFTCNSKRVHIQKSYLWKDFLWGREEVSVDNELRGYVVVLLLQRQNGSFSMGTIAFSINQCSTVVRAVNKRHYIQHLLGWKMSEETALLLFHHSIYTRF